MRTPEWLKNLRWNVEELGAIVGAHTGSPPVIPEPTGDEVVDYFLGYLEDAREMVVKTLSQRNRLATIIDRLGEGEDDRREALRTSLRILDLTIDNEKAYLQRLSEKLQELLALNGYQSGAWRVPGPAAEPGDDVQP